MANNFSLKYLAYICVFAMFFAACNSNQSSNNIDSTATATTADTTAMVPAEKAAPAQPATANQSANPSAESQSTAPTSNSKTVIVKKEIKVIVAPVPVAANKGIRKDKAGIYENAETNPLYPGGERAMESYIYNHLNYPHSALNSNTQGTVNISIVVNPNGAISNAQVIGKHLGHGLDEEARRVVSSMHGWRPARVNGKPVKARITLPITFRLGA